jgi:hypothetical protein
MRTTDRAARRMLRVRAPAPLKCGRVASIVLFVLFPTPSFLSPQSLICPGGLLVGLRVPNDRYGEQNSGGARRASAPQSRGYLQPLANTSLPRLLAYKSFRDVLVFSDRGQQHVEHVAHRHRGESYEQQRSQGACPSRLHECVRVYVRVRVRVSLCMWYTRHGGAGRAVAGHSRTVWLESTGPATA